MTKKIVFGVALALVIVGIAAPSASAACNPPKSISTYNSGTGAFVYYKTTLLDANKLVGTVWSASGQHAGTACNEGPLATTFLYFGATPGDIGMNLSLGDGCVVGCPSGTASFQITASNAAGAVQTIVSKVNEVSGAVNFDVSTQAPADLQLGNAPRPRATSSTRTAPNVNLTIGLDSSAALYRNGTGADITGFNIVSASGLTDPGPSAAAYTLRSFVAAPGGAAGTGAASVDCSNIANDQWVAAQVVSATGGGAASVGPRTRVKCDPTLANPKYNVVPKKGMGTTTQN